MGHLHPLLVHLPIGILLFAFALMLVQQVQRVELRAAISLGFLFGAVSAMLACIAGWLLAQSGDYDSDLVFKHQWTGIATAILSFLAYFIHRFRWILAIASIILLTIAGHYGGNLTHGEGFLFSTQSSTSLNEQKTDSMQSTVNQPIASFLDTSKLAKQATIHKSYIYRDQIEPILKAKCYNCHSATKKKGGLRLDTEDFIRKGGKNGHILTAGNPDKSTFFTNLILPIDDEKHMPPKGKRQLTTQEIAIIHFWIKKGASFVEEMETVSTTASNPVLAIPPISIPQFSNLPSENIEDTSTGEDILLTKQREVVSPEIVEKLKQKQISVSYLNKDSNYISVNFVNVKKYSSALIDDLKGTTNQLIRAKLNNQPVTDEDVKKLTYLKNLTQLNLENTAITDASLTYLKDLPNLEHLNLYGTNITDKGIEALANCPKLKVVYLWQTKTTTIGISQLRKALPNLKIETGNFQLIKPDTNKIK